MRKAILLFSPVMLAGLMLYVVWEPVPEPTARGQKTAPDVRVLEDVTPRARIQEGDREPLRASGMEIPKQLTIEEYQEVHEQLVRRHANSVRMIRTVQGVIDTARTELIRRSEFAQLQRYNLDEMKYRRAIVKLDDGQFSKVSWPLGSPSVVLRNPRNTEIGTSLSLKFDTYSIWFEFLPSEFPELFSIMDAQVEARVSVLQFKCDEFNRLSLQDRETRIESHLQARTMIQILKSGIAMDHKINDALKVLRKNLLPSFMVIDQNTYTVRPQ